MNRRELEYKVRDWLNSKDLVPYSVTFTESLSVNGTLAITFLLDLDYDEFLGLSGYNGKCDKTGFTLIPENKTVILFGMGLFGFYIKIGLPRYD